MNLITSTPQAGNGRTGHISHSARSDLLKLRREGAAQLYFELGPSRSIAKLLPAVCDRYGSVSKRTLAQWSTEDHWVDRALQNDREHAATGLERGHDADELAKLDVRRALDITVKKYLALAMKAPVVIRNEQGLKAVIQAIADLLRVRELLREEDGDPSEGRDVGRYPRRYDDPAAPSGDEVLAELELRARNGRLDLFPDGEPAYRPRDHGKNHLH